MSGPGAPVAAIDCGTNSTRLLIADRTGATLLRRMEITRLGAGVDRTRALDPAAVARTLDVLRSYRADMDRHGVGRVRITATSAARDATNRDDFFGPAAEVVGAAPELLDGEEEGRLSWRGATAELDPATGPWLVADIGGGSTELAAGPAPGGGPLAVRSLDVGCVRVTERFLHGDPPTAAELSAATAEVERLLDVAVAEAPALAAASGFVGLAGTVAALARLEQGLETYDRDRLHHHILTAAVVEDLLAGLAAEDAATRRRRPGMEEARADVIVGGAIVLAALMRRLHLPTCLTSEADILDGMAMGLLGG